MKRCLVISMGLTTGETIADQLRTMLEGYVVVDMARMKEQEAYNKEAQKNYDMMVFTSEVPYKICTALETIDLPYVIAGRVINHKNIEQLISLPAGTEVLLINDSKDSAREAIDQLIDIGLDHINYYPYYPGLKEYPKLGVAVTPGEPQLMPDCVERLLDIGTRIMDLKSIYVVQDTLKLSDSLHDSLVVEYIRDIIGITKSIDKSRRAEKESKRILETIFDTVDNGIAYLDHEHRVMKVNSKLQQILGKNRRDLLNKHLSEIMPVIEEGNLFGDSFRIEIRGEEYIIDIEEIHLDRETAYLMMAYPIQKIQRMGRDAKATSLPVGMSQLKSFEDYLSIHPEVIKTLERAACFAKTDATIAIQGENGTGKEIIAQGIHRHSYRKNRPFVPVNIAAISNNLLESELFGYEKGSFTGASKEGKRGLFELADGGTLFIDEIGDAPLDIQVKLLRVLQEKKVRRIGGADEISVDVRVITATNKELLSLVDKGDFREDLYFRLNILPLYTIPLRLRRQDIEHLLQHFIALYFGEGGKEPLRTYFNEETLKYLNNYRWRGNVRELINLVEYLSYIYIGQAFELGDLPRYYLEQNIPERHLSEDEIWVLNALFQLPGGGRVSLSKRAKEEDYPLGEGQVRRLLSNLQEEGFIEHQVSGRGLCISDTGQRLLSKYS